MLDTEEGKKAVELARQAISTYLKKGERPDLSKEVTGEFKKKRGVFVTLNKNGNLRGCIGRPLPDQTLIDGLIDSAINSATGDPRFPSVEQDELDNITIEVSVLTVPEEIDVEDPKNFPEKIEVGRDGLIVECRGRKGLLLPQVPVDNNWDVEQFLSQTCLKAGLSPDEWLSEGVKIEKFSAQVFKEKEPGGEVIPESLS